jgi:hypothetical protein
VAEYSGAPDECGYCFTWGWTISRRLPNGDCPERHLHATFGPAAQFGYFVTAILPVPSHMISCGKRTDLPTKQRRHQWEWLGLDTRNCGEHGFWDMAIRVCIRCGRDDKVWPSEPLDRSYSLT